MINGKLLADMLQNDHFAETRIFLWQICRVEAYSPVFYSAGDFESPAE